MIDKPPSLKGPNTRIPIIIPIKGRGLIHQLQTSELGFKVWGIGLMKSTQIREAKRSWCPSPQIIREMGTENTPALQKV